MSLAEARSTISLVAEIRLFFARKVFALNVHPHIDHADFTMSLAKARYTISLVAETWLFFARKLFTSLANNVNHSHLCMLLAKVCMTVTFHATRSSLHACRLLTYYTH
jgi:hypothetical protein